MPPDRSRVLQQAQLLASRGQFEAAIAEWKKLAMEMPGDGSIHNSIGDLHLKRNVPGEAATAFLQAASAFRAEGATLKAIAAFKKVLKCDPTRYEVYRHLGDLNVERGLISSAVQDYLTLGKYYLKERRGKDALEIYKKIVTQDPSNLNAQQRVAELCVQENQQDEATTVYLQLGREKSAQGRYDEAKDAYLAVLRIDPANSEAAQFVDSLEKGGTGAVKAIKPSSPPGGGQKPPEPPDLLTEAMRRIEQKQYEGAEAILNQILTREPGNPGVCQLLARLHLQRGDVQVALGEYRFLAGAALRAHDLGLAESLIEEFLSAEPNSVPLLELKGELFEEKGDHGGASLQYAKAVELLLEHPEPGMESLHEELFEKVKALSNDETFVNQLAAKIHGGATGEPSEPLQTASVEDAINDGDSAQDGSDVSHESGRQHSPPNGLDEVRGEVQGFSLEGAEPDDVNPFAKDPGASAVKATPAPETHPTPADAPSMRSSSVPKAATQVSANPRSEESRPKPEPGGGKVPSPPPPPEMATKEAAAAPPDYEAHYALGVAYKNMGLYEEAKEEFQVSMNSESFYLDSALMTAVCLKEGHHIDLAIRGLETTLADPRCEGAKGQAIRYELGLLYETEEQWEKAAHAFQSIPSFHDVPQRLAAIKGKQGGGDGGFRYAS
ncbi:MAG: tetratricopeptide repeat protein [Nitrospira sp.]|nr:tetratricopeptide repeat protein [Nitrospira sp.]